MVTIRTPIRTWVARNGYMYIGNVSGVVFSNAVSLSGAFSEAASGVAIEAAVKNITITPPETSWEKQDFCGTNSSGFQNQLLDEKPVGLSTITATMILGENEIISDLIMSGTANGIGYSRRQIGKGDEYPESTDSTYAVVVTLISDTTRQVSFAVDNAKITKWGDVRISGPDGHWEQDITLLCLTKDFYWEFKD